MSLEQCEICGRFIYSWAAPHVCPPAWEVWSLGWNGGRDGANVIYASDPEDAAKEWAKQMDAEGDYTIIQGSEETVYVAARGSDDVQRFEVSGEMVPEYRAEKLD